MVYSVNALNGSGFMSVLKLAKISGINLFALTLTHSFVAYCLYGLFWLSIAPYNFIYLFIYFYFFVAVAFRVHLPIYVYFSS